MTTVYKFKAGYTKLGVATAPSSAPTITIVDSANNILASAQATTSLSNMAGVYLYSYTGTTGLDLVALFRTSDATMDAPDLLALPDISAAYYTPLGAGSTSTAITINDGTNPIDGVDVWITTDSAGANIVARGYTNVSGIITFMLDPATYYVWKQLTGYTFTNPQSMVVT